MAQGETCGTENVSIDELENSMARELSNYRLLRKNHDQETELSMIFRVQKHMKQVDKLSYEPMIFSIGPYYHGNSSLVFMEKVKWNCLDYILKLNTRQKLEDYLTVMEGLEKKARNCYSEETMLESSMFLRMLLLDGCFLLMYLGGTVGLSHNELMQEEIIEHSVREGARVENTRSIAGTSNMCSTQSVELACNNSGIQTDKYGCFNHSNRDPILKWYDSRAVRDLFLLENQLPFFVVKRIYEVLVGVDATDLLIENVCKCVEFNVKKYTTVTDVFARKKDFHHLLHLCHMYFRPQRMAQQQKCHNIMNRWFRPLNILRQKHFQLSNYSEGMSLDEQTYNVYARQALNQRWRRAEQYHEAGIEFKRKENNGHNPHSLLDMAFDKGEIEIPCLLIDENTACLFRNLLAFEQTCPQFGNDFTAYVAFISQLVSTPRDVALLARKGVIIHHMRTDDEVSTLFSKLGKNVDFDQSSTYYLKSVYQMMEEYYQNRINRWMAWLWHNHFRNPWLVLAVMAAALVLLCTTVQLLVAFLAYMAQTKATN